MLRLLTRLCFGVAALMASASMVADASGPPARWASPIRGLWVPRTSLTSPQSIATMVRTAADGGFNTLLVQVRGRGEAFYRSAIEPRATDLDREPVEFDPLESTIAAARQAGLAVHAWVNVNLVASGVTLPRSRDHVALQHPDWLMVPRALAGPLGTMNVRSPGYLGTLMRWTRGGIDQVEGLYVSPVTAAARAYTTSVIAELAARYPLDGIHLDYIRYPSAEFDFSPVALEAFRESLVADMSRPEADRLDRAASADPTAWATARPAEWAAFHRGRLTSLVGAVQSAARAARPGLVVSAAVVGAAADARDLRHQDWLNWARAGYLDVACPMLYAQTSEQFASVASDIHEALGAVPFWAGIGAYRLPIDATIERVRLARRANAAGVLLFSYGQLADSATTPAVMAAVRPVLLEASDGSGRPR